MDGNRVQLGTKSPSRWKAHVEHAKHIFRGDNYFEALYEDSKVRVRDCMVATDMIAVD